ncbi:DUF4097 family beta strand repeat-containing protein [Lentibacillus saliphilus]|uniref:DUF4097 family beta strand repeat-containing protein n=1 Tax=Lentibacillus saliphilus TaxID=2737028 RepID=UPI001C30DC4D|nr:DUF4097 family beta strand repeat-containing protein [Lentibacillus saliphilus]
MVRGNILKTVVESLRKGVEQTYEKTVKKASIDPQNVLEFVIETDMVNVDVQMHNARTVDVMLESFEGGPELDYQFDRERGVISALVPSQSKNIFRVINQPQCRLNIMVPHGLANKWNVAATSGNVHLHSIQTEAIHIKGSSGNIKVTDLNATDCSIKASSGNVKIVNSTLNHLSFKVSSGNTYVEDVSCDVTDGQSTSGNLKLLNFHGHQAQLKGSSGNIQLQQIHVKEDVGCLVSSGNMKGEDVHVGHLSAEASSGNVKMDNFKGRATGNVGSGSIHFNVLESSSLQLETRSGNVQVTYVGVNPDASFDLVAPANSVTTTVPFNFKQQQTDRLSAVSGNGTYAVQLKTKHGRIKVNQE